MVTKSFDFPSWGVDGRSPLTNAIDRIGTYVDPGAPPKEAGMSDPRLHSLHLEGQPRRDTFRTAREKLQAACGSQTLAGDIRLLDDADLNKSTLAASPGVFPIFSWVSSPSTLKTAETFTPSRRDEQYRAPAR